MQNYILYQAANNINAVNECRYSLLKYLSVYNLNPPADTKIIIYTDKPALFESYTSFFNEFILNEYTVKNISKWDLLKNNLSNYKGNFLYLDTDTYPVQPLNDVFKNIAGGTLYFFEEANLNDEEIQALQKIKESLQKQPIKVSGNRIEYPQNFKMYPGKAIGIGSSRENVLDEVSELSHLLTKKISPSVAGNFAGSYYFNTYSVEVLKGKLMNYRNLPEFKKLLQIFFKKNEEESIPNLVKLIHHLDVDTIKKEKDQYLQLTFYKKWMNVLSGKSWSIKQYQKKI